MRYRLQTIAEAVAKESGMNRPQYVPMVQLDADDYKNTRITLDHKQEDGKIVLYFNVSMAAANAFNDEEMKDAFFHEIGHKSCPAQSDNTAAELCADRNAALHDDPQKVIRWLDKLGALSPENYSESFTHENAIPYPTIREREEALEKAFPDRRLTIVEPVETPSRFTLQPGPQLAASRRK
jgi:hypothetical protein